MKKSIAILLFTMMVIPAISQVKFGIKAGAATTTVPEYQVSTGTITPMQDATWGFHGGIFLRAGIGPVYLQPEIYFATNTYEYNVQTNSVSDILDQSFNRIEIPVLLGLKLGPVRLNAGPSATVPIGRPSALINDPNWDDIYRGTTFGYQAGVGVDIFNTITLDARYGGSLSERFGDSVQIGNTDFRLDERQPSLILSLGIMF